MWFPQSIRALTQAQASSFRLQCQLARKVIKVNSSFRSIKDTRHIEYAVFYQKLRQLNPDFDFAFAQRERVHEALKSTIVETVGWKEFSLMKQNPENIRKSKNNSTRATRDSSNSWFRLQGEEKTFWAAFEGSAEQPNARGALKLPSYASMDQMKYRRFFDELREMNAHNLGIGSYQAKKALKQVFIGIIGEKDFNRMRMSNAMGQHRTEWTRLLNEAAEYHRGRG